MRHDLHFALHIARTHHNRGGGAVLAAAGDDYVSPSLFRDKRSIRINDGTGAATA